VNPRRAEKLLYAAVVILSFIILGLLAMIPPHALRTQPVYQRF